MTLELQAFESFIAGRHSVRRFAVDPVPEALVRRLLAAAVRAPSAHNRQPWRFAVVRSGGERRRLGEAMAARFRADLLADGLSPQAVERQVGRSQERLQEAPLAVVLCLSLKAMDVYPDARRREAERMMAVQSAALAGGHLLLAAHAAGLGACWICGPLFAPEAARTALDLPESWEPQAVIVLGYPAGEARPTERREPDEVTLWR